MTNISIYSRHDIPQYMRLRYFYSWPEHSGDRHELLKISPLLQVRFCSCWIWTDLDGCRYMCPSRNGCGHWYRFGSKSGRDSNWDGTGIKFCLLIIPYPSPQLAKWLWFEEWEGTESNWYLHLKWSNFSKNRLSLFSPFPHLLNHDCLLHVNLY